MNTGVEAAANDAAKAILEKIKAMASNVTDAGDIKQLAEAFAIVVAPGTAHGEG